MYRQLNKLYISIQIKIIEQNEDDIEDGRKPWVTYF